MSTPPLFKITCLAFGEENKFCCASYPCEQGYWVNICYKYIVMVNGKWVFLSKDGKWACQEIWKLVWVRYEHIGVTIQASDKRDGVRPVCGDVVQIFLLEPVIFLGFSQYEDKKYLKSYLIQKVIMRRRIRRRRCWIVKKGFPSAWASILANSNSLFKHLQPWDFFSFFVLAHVPGGVVGGWRGGLKFVRINLYVHWLISFDTTLRTLFHVVLMHIVFCSLFFVLQKLKMSKTSPINLEILAFWK